MPNFDFEKMAGVTFEEIFGLVQDKITPEQVEIFLDKTLKIAAENAKTNPNQLVCVVSSGTVTWMTQKQALCFLKLNDTDDMKHDIERALRGDLKIIRQELEILLAIAMYTFKQFKKDQTTQEKEIERITPGLTSRRNELDETLSETKNLETALKEKRSQTPFIEKYEQLME